MFYDSEFNWDIDKMKKLIIILFVLIFNVESFSQLQFIKFSSDYSSGLTKRLSVTRAEALGGTLDVGFNVSDLFTVTFSGGYQLFNIDQDSALAQWNWLFWETRYRGNIQAAIQSDPAMKGILTPIHKMDFFPVLIKFSKEFKLFNNLFVKPEIGGGMIFVTRRLILEETWSRYFDQINYNFQYSYYNFADDKKANPVALYGGLNLSYEFAPGYRIHSDFNYLQILKTEDKFGYNAMPFENSLNIKLGLTFLY